jgi:hypothetical protein
MQQYSGDLISKIEQSKNILSQMISNAISQQAQNFDMLYSLQHALEELKFIVQNKSPADNLFLQKWDNIMGWAPRVLEDHPLLDLIRGIDKEIAYN